MAKQKTNKTISYFLFGSIGLFIIDQIIKALIVSKEKFFEGKLLSMHLVINTGASFSILSGENKLLIWISFIVIGLFLFNYDKIEEQYLGLSILALGGVFSNLVDRIFREGVIDFIDFHWWPVFNIADSMIVVGVLGIIYLMIKEEWQERQRISKKKEKTKIKKK